MTSASRYVRSCTDGPAAADSALAETEVERVRIAVGAALGEGLVIAEVAGVSS